jgi:hypothetical protein
VDAGRGDDEPVSWVTVKRSGQRSNLDGDGHGDRQNLYSRTSQGQPAGQRTVQLQTQVDEHCHFPQADVAKRWPFIERQRIECRDFLCRKLTSAGGTTHPPNPGVRVQQQSRSHIS